MVRTVYIRSQPWFAFIERNFALLRRYWPWELSWTVYSGAMVLSIGFLAVGMERVSGVDVPEDKILVYLLTGSLLWRYLSELFWETSNVISWERWEGTLEYTLMAPISRFVYLLGSSLFAVVYSGLRLVFLMVLCALFFRLDLASANIAGAAVILAIATFSLMGLGLMGACLPLMSPEKGMQMTGIIEAVLLLVSGIYYPIEVLPHWLQYVSRVSPITYTLKGMRACLIDGASLAAVWPCIWPLLISGAIMIPLGLKVFAIAETYCKRKGRLKRSG